MFLLGTGIFVALGDISVHNPFGKIGAAVMLAGMILTSFATILSSLRQQWKQRDRIEELQKERQSPPEPPPPTE